MSQIGCWDFIDIHIVPVDARPLYSQSISAGANQHDALDNGEFSNIICNHVANRSSLLHENTQFLQTRVDTDDLLGPHFFNVIQHASDILIAKHSLQVPYLLDFPLGLQGTLDQPKLTLFPENNFTTLVLDKTQFTNGLSTYSFPHDRLPESVKRISISTHLPMWWQVLHGMNDANSVFPWSIPYSPSINDGFL